MRQTFQDQRLTPDRPLVAIRRLTAGYGGTTVLHDLSLVVQRGELVALIGPNGSGKSTLLRAITGRLPSWGGEIHLWGRPLAQWSVPALARRVAVVAQEEPAPFALPVEQVVAMGRTPHLGRFQREGPADRRKVREAMGRAGVVHLAGRPFNQLPRASASGWSWPGPWPRSPSSSSWMSPRATWTSATRWRFWTSWPASAGRKG